MPEIRDAFADLDSLHACDRHDIAGAHFLGFITLQSAECEELGNFRWLNRSVQLRDAYFCSAHERPAKYSRDGHAPEKIAVIEIGDLNLQRRSRVARRLGNGSHDFFKQGLKCR